MLRLKKNIFPLIIWNIQRFNYINASVPFHILSFCDNTYNAVKPSNIKADLDITYVSYPVFIKARCLY